MSHQAHPGVAPAGDEERERRNETARSRFPANANAEGTFPRAETIPLTEAPLASESFAQQA
jgi:hypothetical protein